MGIPTVTVSPLNACTRLIINPVLTFDSLGLRCLDQTHLQNYHYLETFVQIYLGEFPLPVNPPGQEPWKILLVGIYSSKWIILGVLFGSDIVDMLHLVL